MEDDVTLTLFNLHVYTQKKKKKNEPDSLIIKPH